MDRDFLLDTAAARQLYHECAEGMPIMDFHSHLDPEKICDDYRFRSITELWLDSGEYKWRAMRANGVSERYISGDATDWEKFSKWAETVPYLMRNPLYHWTHLELSRVFGIEETLNPQTAESIFQRCNEMLQDADFTARSLIRRFKVTMIGTANDMCDPLVFHRKMRLRGDDLEMVPTWKPDRLFEQESPSKFCRYIEEFANAADMTIRTYADLLEALRKRHAFFHSQGCRMSDLSIDRFYVADYNLPEVDEAFQKILEGRNLTEQEQERLKASLLMDLCELDYKSGWTQQYHIGVQTDLNNTMFRLLGRHRGFDGMNDLNMAQSTGRFFNRVFERGLLCRTIVFNLNPKDTEMLAVILGCFQDGSMAGKLQLGAAWWYLNNEWGIRRQLDALSAHGLLARFVGMATDSHCFLSYCRHEYFRRILCQMLGQDVERGSIPASEHERLMQMVKDICYCNAEKYFKG